MRWRPKSLSAKLILLVILTTGTAMAVLTLTHVLQTREREYRIAHERLERKAQENGAKILRDMQQMSSDARLLASFPPVSGLERAMASPDGIDPRGGSTIDDWRMHLAAIFESTIRERPTYTQMRFIGAAENWREIVRINRRNDEIEIEAKIAPQSKADEPYLEAVAELRPGDQYFSQISRSREDGEIRGPATIRVIQPVFSSTGTIFGAIVINADFEALLRHAATNLPPDMQVTLMTARGNHLTYGREIEAPELRADTDPVWTQPPNWDLRRSEGHTIRAGKAVFFETLPISAFGSPFELRVMTEMPVAGLLLPARAEIARSTLLAVGMLLAATSAASILGRRLTRPLMRLHAAIRLHARNGNPIRLPAAGDDEIGELSVAFETLTRDIVDKRNNLEGILHGASSAIFVVDEDGQIDQVNPAAEALFGYAPGDLSGRNVACLTPPEIAVLHQGFAGNHDGAYRKMAATREIEALRSDGSRVPIEISVSRVPYRDGWRIIGIARDISERKRAAARLQEMLDALERSNAELDQFAYVASHDLRTPLRVIDNSAAWLAEDLEDVLTDETRETLDLLRNRVKRMDKLLDDLLQHARIGRVSVSDELVNGADLMRDVAGLLEVPTGIELRIDPGFSQVVVARMPLQTVMLNLVGNAIKHHDCDRGRIDIALTQHGSELEIVVTDDGPGIPPAYHSKIFGLFQTLKPSDQLEANGMGLAFVHKYAALVGGRVTVESDGSRGTTFRLFWPIAAERPAVFRKCAS